MLVKKIIDSAISCSPAVLKKNILRMALYTAKKVRETPGSYTYDVHQRLLLDNILSEQKAKLDKEVSLENLCKPTERIRIRILYPSGTAWNCIGSLYNALIQDDSYQTVVITEDYPNYIRVMEEKQCFFIRLNDYDIKKDKPDVLILTSYSSTTPLLNFEGIRNYTKCIISLFPNIVINEYSMKKHWDYVAKAYEHCVPDYYLFDSLVFNNSKEYIDEKKALLYGNPQFDDLYKKLTSDNGDVPISWNKLNGKKTFLWATDHCLNEYYPIDAVSIDLYIQFIINYFSKHTDYGLIIRFHPFLIREMKQSGLFWSSIDFKRFVDFCNNSPNIVWDDTPDYCNAFKKCDALLIDANCGFTVSFLATGKPICRLLRGDMTVHLIHPELKDNYYYCTNTKELECFIQDFLSGKDPLQNKREHAFQSSILHFDGRNGERIKRFLDNLLKNKQ